MNEQIFLSKNFTIIESGIPFTLRFNRKDSSANSAEDTIYMKSGWYIFDNNKLLPYEVEGVKNSPKYNAWVEYDETKLNERVGFRWYTSWVNPKSIESLNSDVYELDAVQFVDITDKIGQLIALNIEHDENLDQLATDMASVESCCRSIASNANLIKKDVGNMSLDVGDVVRLLGSLDGDTLLNKLEQIRTVLKSPASAGNATPWGSLLDRFTLDYYNVELESGFATLPNGLYFGVLNTGIGDKPNETYHKFSGVFVIGSHRDTKGIFSVHLNSNDSLNGAVFAGSVAYLPSGQAVPLFGSGFAGVRLAF